ncbi:hypothetical protein TWF694_001958 [Orbilia ellipsospora]|uniref:Peptidase C14 caspase domain-containing protein n=1 Tax=Orbilia ellipsospora TaxID=2528407 RepID=A0AAV9X5D3_9PEZI
MILTILTPKAYENDTNKNWALLIGIDNYFPGTQRKVQFNNLKGCVQDIRAIANQLQALGFHYIKTLTSSGPNLPVESKEDLPIFENILRELNYIYEEACPGDLVYIHYSGHGIRRDSCEIDEDEVGDYITGAALVLADVMQSGPYFTGHNLGRFVQNMVEGKELRVNVILDSCFSGRGLRDADSDGYTIRGGEFHIDEDILPCDQKADEVVDKLFPSRHRNARVVRSWISNPTGCSILTACQFDETAAEYDFDDDGSHGVLTYWILKLLKTPSTCRPSFARVREYAASKIKSMKPQRKQSPVLHGDGNYMFLGVESVIEKPVGRVLDRNGTDVILDVGWAQGVVPGALYDVFPEGQLIRPDSIPKMQARIIQVHPDYPFQSKGELVFNSHENLSSHSPQDQNSYTDSIYKIQQGSSIVLRDWALPFKTLLNLSSRDSHTLDTKFQKLKLIIEQTRGVILDLDGGAKDPAFSIVLDQDLIEIHQNGKRLHRTPKISTKDEEWVEKIAYIVRHIARFHHIQSIDHNKIKAEDRLPSNWFIFEVTDDKNGVFNSRSEGVYHTEEYAELTFTFTITGKCPLSSVYLAVYGFMPSWGIHKQHPGPGQASFQVCKGVPETFWLQVEVPPASCKSDPMVVNDIVRAFVCTSQETWEEIELPDLPHDASFNPGTALVYGADAFDNGDGDHRNTKRKIRKGGSGKGDRIRWAILDVRLRTYRVS